MQITPGTAVEIFTAPALATAPKALSTLAKPMPAAEVQLPVSATEITATKVDYDPERSLAAFTAVLDLGADMQDIAGALRRNMRTIVEDRPELSSANFDFETDNGRITVLSDDLNADDRNWIEGLLNKNTDLMTAVTAFHNHYMAMYRGAVGSKMADQTIGQRVDKSVQFMSLLGELGSDTQRTLIRSEGTFQRIDGGRLDLSRGAGNANDFLDYMEQTDRIQEGSISFTTRKGKVIYEALRMSNPFTATGFKLQKTLYDSLNTAHADKTVSLGFYEKA